jgi:hypothetical protein
MGWMLALILSCHATVSHAAEADAVVTAIRLAAAAGTKAGHHEKILIDSMGGAEAQLLSCDNTGIVVRMQGGTMNIDWKMLGPKSLFSIGERYLPDAAESRVELAFFAIEQRLRPEARRTLEKIVSDDAALRERLLKAWAALDGSQPKPAAAVEVAGKPKSVDVAPLAQTPAPGPVARQTAPAASTGPQKPELPHCIPAERLADWHPGVEGGIPEYPVSVRLSAEELAAEPDAAKIIQRAVNRATPESAVLLPEGTFNLKSAIDLKNTVVLRGMGLDKTHLIADMPKVTWHGVVACRGDWEGNERRIAGELKAGSRDVILESAAGLKPDQPVLINSENVDSEMYPGHPEWRQDWAKRAVGQIARIVSVEGNTVRLDAPIRLSRSADLKPGLRPMRPLRRAGIEALHIKRNDQAEDVIIDFSRAENCWIRDCELEYCMRGHVGIAYSRFISVENNFIHHAYNYAGGGHGYGISMGGNATDCLIQNNAFFYLRHALICGGGTNGNVYAYNFCCSQHDNEPNNRLRDMSVHGHYSYMELFEGNTVEFGTSSDWWGSAGPLITFFRNRFDPWMGEFGQDGWMPPVQILYSSHRQNVVGNSLVRGQGVQVQKGCNETLLEGNLIHSRVEWNQAREQRLPTSLYLKGKPHFWGRQPWPAIGADVDQAANGNWVKLPAQEWYEFMQREKRSVPFRESQSQGVALTQSVRPADVPTTGRHE